MPLPQRKRLSTGSKTLDEMMGGGLLQETTTLVSGAPGAGKTTLGLQFLLAGIETGQAGLLISFEEFPASVIRDAAQLGWDLKTLEKEGRFGLIFTSPEVFLQSLQSENQGPIAHKIQQLQPERVVIDSVSHFQRLTRRPVELREIFNILVNAFKRQGITSLLLDEAANIMADSRGHRAALPFLVDAVLLLRYVEVDSAIQRAIAIMKMRGSNHQKQIRRFTIQPGGLEIGEPFTGRAGILSGAPHRTA